MITRRKALQGMMAAAALGTSRTMWATDAKGHVLEPGQTLKPGEYVWEPELSPEGPVVILVSVPEQMAHVYRNGIEIGVTTVSTGRPGHLTPTGVFVILQKDKDHHSSIYHNASMPNTQRLTWGGICLHAGSLPGYPVSHGCVHLPLEFSAELFAITHLNTPVIIADDSSAPADVVHPGMVLSADADKMVADELAKVAKGAPSHEGSDPDRVAIASVLVSAADGRSYLFLDGEIVNQKPVTIANPEQPLGTHVMVLRAFEGQRPVWSSVAIAPAGSTAAGQPTDGQTLERITFDPGFMAQISAAMHPGMTMMITDLAAEPDTRSEQGFVIMTSEFVES